MVEFAPNDGFETQQLPWAYLAPGANFLAIHNLEPLNDYVVVFDNFQVTVGPPCPNPTRAPSPSPTLAPTFPTRSPSSAPSFSPTSAPTASPSFNYSLSAPMMRGEEEESTTTIIAVSAGVGFLLLVVLFGAVLAVCRLTKRRVPVGEKHSVALSSRRTPRRSPLHSPRRGPSTLDPFPATIVGGTTGESSSMSVPSVSSHESDRVNSSHRSNQSVPGSSDYSSFGTSEYTNSPSARYGLMPSSANANANANAVATTVYTAIPSPESVSPGSVDRVSQYSALARSADVHDEGTIPSSQYRALSPTK